MPRWAVRCIRIFRHSILPISSTERLAAKMEEFGRPYALHIFESGRHGMSVNNRITDPVEEIDPEWSQWVEKCVDWLEMRIE